ncbi:MAG: porphobilinogen synthase [Clostridia bacterium]
MNIRPRRLRNDKVLRDMVREIRLSPKSLILPIFIKEGTGVYSEISSLDGHFYYSADTVHKIIEKALEHSVKSFMLFGIPEHKDEIGSEAFGEHSVVQEAVRAIKKDFPDVQVITDVCMCEYTSHGHCGIIHGQTVDNDETLEYLAKIAVSHAKAGADMIAPSDMMDGRVQAIRDALDSNGFKHIPIMSYSAKYSSAFYGPFRDVANSAPSFGDRKTYQMDYHNSREAVREMTLDVQEGADIIMVKPALSYLDIINKAKDTTDCPICAYSVSGEYAMIKASAKAGIIDEYGIMCETTVSIFRAGADILITYYALDIADAILRGDIG